MSVTRYKVLEELAKVSDARAEETTTISALAQGLGIDEEDVKAHLVGLEACELARSCSDDGVRVTVTGEQLLELDTDDLVIVDPTRPNTC